MADQSIPNYRRELYFRIIDGFKDFHAITQRLHFLDNHFPPHQLDAAIAWLIANGVTGQYFVNWFNTQCAGSDLEMQRRLVHIVTNAPIGRLVAGKTFKL